LPRRCGVTKRNRVMAWMTYGIATGASVLSVTARVARRGRQN
jgi:hypothetical protein